MSATQLTVLTYNVQLNGASKRIPDLINKYRPDIVALQEIDTRFENLMALEKHGYKLADYANCFFRRKQIHGVATYYNTKVFQLEDSGSYSLRRNTYERLLIFLQGDNRPRAVLRTNFVFKKTGQNIHFYNLHLSAYGTNHTRIQQMRETFARLNGEKMPTVVAGDFNFPYKREKFEEIIRTFNLKEATNAIYVTFHKRLLGLVSLNFKLDYILYRNIEVISTQRLEETHSDHFPLFSTFVLSA